MINVPLPPEPAPGQPLSASWGATLLRWCRANQLLPTAGALLTRTPGGTSFRPRPVPLPGGSASAPAAFDITINAKTGVTATFYPGTGQGILPTNWGDAIQVPAGQVSYAFLRLNTDGDSVQSCELRIDTDQPDPLDPTMSTRPQTVNVLLHLIDYEPATDGGPGTYKPYRLFNPPGDVTLTSYVAFTTPNDNDDDDSDDVWYTWRVGSTYT